jgi:hypothetical protein
MLHEEKAKIMNNAKKCDTRNQKFFSSPIKSRAKNKGCMKNRQKNPSYYGIPIRKASKPKNKIGKD